MSFKMKKLALFIFSVSCIGCKSGLNQFCTLKSHNSDISNLDFTKGRWLIGDIDVNLDAKNDLTQRIKKDFSEYLGD